MGSCKKNENQRKKRGSIEIDGKALGREKREILVVGGIFKKKKSQMT